MSSKLSECELCGVKIKASNIKKHKKEHFDEKLKCNFCEVTFKHQASLCRHQVQQHNVIIGKEGNYSKKYKYQKKDPFPCTYCDKMLGTKVALQSHTMIHTGEKPYKCDRDQCGKSFRQSTTLIKHVNYMHERDKLEMETCSICDKSFLGKRYLVTHISATHKSEKKIESCNECDFKGPFLKTHYKKAHEIKNRKKCNCCRVTLENDMRLIAHKIFFHELKDSCPECDKKCSNVEVLVNHMEQHHSSKRYKCEICFKEFKQNRMFIRHQDCHKEKTLQCKFCESKFSNNMSKRAHEKGHVVGFKPKKRKATGLQSNKNKKFPCSMCPKMFATEFSLSNHEQCHKERRLFECKICKDKFPNQGRLNKHSDIHTTIFPFQCKYCGRGSKQGGTHKRHEKVCLIKIKKQSEASPKEVLNNSNIQKAKNEVEKFLIQEGELWKCKQCNKTGKQRIQIRLHAEEHITGLSFQCLFCEKEFNTRKTLSTHKRNIHKHYTYRRIRVT